MILTESDFEELKSKARQIKAETEAMTNGKFLGGRVQTHYKLIGLLVLQINSDETLMKVELPNGVFIRPQK
jgi:hypothetical protein